MDIIIQAFYILFCLGLAYYNARLIKQDKRIYHGLNGLAHFTMWGLSFLITKDFILLAMLPFMGRLFFDVALNLMRGLDLDYVTDDPRSIIDCAEQLFFKEDGLTPKIIYAFVWLMLNVVNALI